MKQAGREKRLPKRNRKSIDTPDMYQVCSDRLYVIFDIELFAFLLNLLTLGEDYDQYDFQS